MSKTWFWLLISLVVLVASFLTVLTVFEVAGFLPLATAMFVLAGVSTLFGGYVADPKYATNARGSGIVRFLKHILIEGWLPATVFALALAASAASYQLYGFRLDTLNSLGSDWLIAWKQLERSEQMDEADVILVGDSSCLMGIDAGQASKALDVRVESLCSLAWIGPAGYAQVLGAYLERHSNPVEVLMLMSTSGLNRDPSWKQFETIDIARNTSQPRMGGIAGGQQMLRYLFEPIFYQPLPTGYGQYFGGRYGFVRHIQDNHGTTIDPTNGLQFGSLEEYLELRQMGAVGVVEPQPSEEFARAGEVFARLVDRYPEVRHWFGIMPVASAEWSEAALATWRQQAIVAAQMLGVPANRVLPLPATRPIGDFSTDYHLHRWGRRLYTDDFAEILSATVLTTRCRHRDCAPGN